MAGHNCPNCGDQLPPDAPESLCPKCLLNLAASPAGHAGADAGPDPDDDAFSVESVQADFPQLEIIECIGRGGMGVVFTARQPGPDRVVALKVLAPKVKNDPAFAERFQREARALARLTHPNIVALHDFGESNGRWYVLMEYVDGISVREALDGARLSPEEAMVIVPAVCGALQYAHDRGIVHRDIKPENLLLDREGRVKIVDFGLAKIVEPDGADARLTGTRDVMGTPPYMAPEQFERPPRADHRADIYALGVVFYEMLTGELPMGRFSPPSRKVRVDVRLDEVVLRTLEREPERRYQQAGALKTDVESIASGAEPDAAPAAAPAPAGSPPVAGARSAEFVTILNAVASGLCLSGGAKQLDDRNYGFALVCLVAGIITGAVAIARRHHIKPRTDPERRNLAWYGLAASVVGLPVGLAFGAHLLWGLALIGIFVASQKLGLWIATPSPRQPEASLEPAAPSRALPPAWAVPAALAAVAILAVDTLLILADGILSGLGLTARFLPAASVLAIPPAVVIAREFVRRWTAPDAPGDDGRGRAWLRAWGWIAVLLAIPAVALGLLFLNAVAEEGGFRNWHPAPDEALVVPLVWLGALLLPLAAWVLLRAARGPAHNGTPRR